VAAALVLAARPDAAASPDRNALEGSTELNRPIRLVFLDGKLHGVQTLASFQCGTEDYWRSGKWTPTRGFPGVRIREDGRRFEVREKGTLPEIEPPVTVDYVLRGRLADGEESATGTLAARVVFGRGRDSMSCRGTVRFTASDRTAVR
jgi:hypothetical protein